METVKTVKIVYTIENCWLKVFKRYIFTLEVGKSMLCPFSIFPWHNFSSLDIHLSYFHHIKIKTTIL